MDCWSCLLSLLLSLFMTWILKLKGGLRVQGGEWDEMKELQPGCLTALVFSTGIWEHHALT